MSVPARPAPVILAVAGLLASGVDEAEVEARLAERFGPVAETLPFAPFTATGYYAAEMGEGLRRGFWAFVPLADPGDLAEIKLVTNDLEREFAREGSRRVNLDPGALDMGSLVLATGKSAAHRVYLRYGIWGEIEYLYRNGSYLPLEWTYPDYREERVVGWFNTLRQRLKEERKAKPCSNP